MTLVELVISISIILLISTLCFPKLNINKYKIDLFTKQLCSDIRYIRNENMLGNLNAYIYYNNDKINSYIVRNDGKDLKKVTLPKETKLSYDQSRIRFKRDGTPDPKGQTIIIYNKDVKKEITIVPVSGRVLLKEGKYETEKRIFTD